MLNVFDLKILNTTFLLNFDILSGRSRHWFYCVSLFWVGVNCCTHVLQKQEMILVDLDFNILFYKALDIML